MPTELSSTFDLENGEPAEPIVTSDEYGAMLVVAVHGSWDERSPVRLNEVLRKCLTEQPPALVLDLQHLDDPHASSASLWLTAARTAESMRPPVRLALCLAPGTALAARLDRRGAKWYVPVFGNVAQARTALAAGSAVPEYRRLTLPPEPDSAGKARALIADACRSWELPQLVFTGRLVMSELVANAVEHAGTDLLVSVARRAGGLYLAVRDGSLALPRLLEPFRGARPDRRGQGLRLVDEVATSWGAMRTHDGTGKVVWASVQPRRTDNE
jgi:anti-sigma regulatory factor (Ser/Thr protein kinase)